MREQVGTPALVIEFFILRFVERFLRLFPIVSDGLQLG